MSSFSSVAALADESALPAAARFSVQARPEPGVMPRILELFAKRGLVPQRFAGANAGAANAEKATALSKTFFIGSPRSSDATSIEHRGRI